jgi:succinate-semialdehyde dehydrogenase/glutarate-semialdehyde dehydrogenase
MSRHLESRNPLTGELLASYPPLEPAALESRLERTAAAGASWRDRPLAERAALLSAVAGRLDRETEQLARLCALEMGKPIREARAEVAKCSRGCRHYAEHAAEYLRADVIPSDATRSYVAGEPLGALFAIMPWNFPFWQVFRCAAPALAAGNTVLLKHAANVPQ